MSIYGRYSTHKSTSVRSPLTQGRLAPPLSSDIKLTLEHSRSLAGGSVEIVYACDA